MYTYSILKRRDSSPRGLSKSITRVHCHYKRNMRMFNLHFLSKLQPYLWYEIKKSIDIRQYKEKSSTSKSFLVILTLYCF